MTGPGTRGTSLTYPAAGKSAAGEAFLPAGRGGATRSKDRPLINFSELGLSETLLRALDQAGYVTPTPIQEQAIPHLVAGRDLLGIAQTGTGKTAAFALPILNRIAADRNRANMPGRTRCLILAPTRELAAQIADNIKTYARHMRVHVAVVVGGVSAGPQIRAIARGLDILVATPGRLVDHLDSGVLKLDRTEVVVLDEADHMLDLGFIIPIRRILAKLPIRRQSLFFSATMPKEIGALAGEMLRDPIEVSVTPVATTAERVEQRVVRIEPARKRGVLIELLETKGVHRALVFTRTKRGADRVAHDLEVAGLPAAAIHGNKSQSQRERALGGFRDGRVRILVATDIAARGIDVSGVSHVFNYELPDVPESYVHRIGRTARAGAEGIAITLCADDELGLLRDIERLTRQTLPIDERRTAESIASAPERLPQRQPMRNGRPASKARPGGGVGRPAGRGHGRPGDRSERSEGPARPQRPQRQGQRAHGDRPNGDRPYGDRPQGDGYRGDRPQGDGYRGDRPQRSSRPARGDRPQGQQARSGEGRPRRQGQYAG